MGALADENVWTTVRVTVNVFRTVSPVSGRLARRALLARLDASLQGAVRRGEAPDVGVVLARSTGASPQGSEPSDDAHVKLTSRQTANPLYGRWIGSKASRTR